MSEQSEATDPRSCCAAVAEEVKALAAAEFLTKSLERQSKFESQLEQAQRDIAALASQLQQSRNECQELRGKLRHVHQTSEEISSLKLQLQQAHEESKEKSVDMTDRRFDEAVSELDQLRSRLRSSEQEREEAKRQQEVAWRLCAVLRDYASHLLDLPPSASSPPSPTEAIDGSCMLEEGFNFDAIKEWMYNNPTSASAWSAVTEKMEARKASQPPIPSLMSGFASARKPQRKAPSELIAQSQRPPRRP
jgi:vacuolar-type H+-ATPase subunit I/STV1